MITTTIAFNGNKEVSAFIAENGKHKLVIHSNPNAVIGVADTTFDFDNPPEAVFSFSTVESVESVIARLETIRAAFSA